jgi:hypothetical protein
MSNRIKEAVSVIVALGLVAVMQYFAARECCRQVPERPMAQRDDYPPM